MFNIGYRAIYDPSILSAITKAKKHGFGVVEVHLTAPQFFPNRYSKKKRDYIKLKVEKSGIILQTHVPLEQSLIFTNPHLRKGAKDHLITMVEFSRDIGARCLTLHPGKAAIYNTVDGKKLKDDSIYSKFYAKLFEDSIRHIISIAPKDLFICIENTDNFTSQYQRVLSKYLPTGKIFLTWDIRKNYTYITNKLIEKQWNFLMRNREYVKNLHVSGFDSVHGNLKGWEDQLDKFFELFSSRNLPLVIEILPLENAVKAKKIIEMVTIKFKREFYKKTLSYWKSRANQYLEEIKPGIIQKIISILKRRKVINLLDAGCGPAHYVIKFVKALGCRATCLDFSARMLKQARENIRNRGLIKKFDFTQGNIIDVALPRNKFDAIVAISILHYLRFDDIKNVCRKFYLSLKYGGSLIIVEYWTQDKLTPTEKKVLKIANQSREIKGIQTTFLKDNDYIKLLTEVGFRNVQIHYLKENIYLDKYFNTERKSAKHHRGLRTQKSLIRVTVFEALK